MTDPLKQSEIIAGRYRLEHLLGEGGMGSVWAATHTITRKPVALKFLKATAVSEPHLRKRFLREARAASAVRHPNVVQVHDILELDDGAPVMVMDLLEGESLGDLHARKSKLTIRELADIMVPVLSAVGTAHAAGVVHRDLKPDNIFLEQTVDGIVPKVLDFGIAKLEVEEELPESSKLTQTGAMLGTPYYMAPEQAFGEHDIDHRVDVWATGVILFECLSGRRPVDGDNLGQLFRVLTTGDIPALGQLAPDVPTDVSALVMRMLRVKRDERPKDLREVFEVLRPYATVRATTFPDAGETPVSTQPTAPKPPRDSFAMATTEAAVMSSSPQRSSKRSPMAMVVAVLVVLAGLTAGVFGWMSRNDASDSALAAGSSSASADVDGGTAGAGSEDHAFAEPDEPHPDVVDATSASESAAADASAAPSVTKRPPKQPVRPGHAHPAKTAPEPPSTAATTPPPAPTPPPTDTGKLPGGVVSKPPF